VVARGAGSRLKIRRGGPMPELSVERPYRMAIRSSSFTQSMNFNTVGELMVGPKWIDTIQV
jgi:hypothetical protein